MTQEMTREWLDDLSSNDPRTNWTMTDVDSVKHSSTELFIQFVRKVKCSYFASYLEDLLSTLIQDESRNVSFSTQK